MEFQTGSRKTSGELADYRFAQIAVHCPDMSNEIKNAAFPEDFYVNGNLYKCNQKQILAFPKRFWEFPKAIGELPKAIGELPKVIGELPKVIWELPKVIGELPKPLGNSYLQKWYIQN
jgi:hypothetical protein